MVAPTCASSPPKERAYVVEENLNKLNSGNYPEGVGAYLHVGRVVAFVVPEYFRIWTAELFMRTWVQSMHSVMPGNSPMP